MTRIPHQRGRPHVASAYLFASLLALGSSSSARAQPTETGAADRVPNESGTTQPEHSDGRLLLVRPFAGVGLTSRSFQRPTAEASQSLASAFVPAVEVGLYVSAWPDSTFSLSLSLHYRTSVLLTVTEATPFAVRNRLSVRSEQIELSVIPSLRLGESASDPRIGLSLGACARTFWPSEHTLMTPGYTLLGPHARIELILPAFEHWTIRLAPEAQWIVAIDAALRRSGVARQGVAWGGEASLTLAFTPTWAVGIHYRESHAMAGGPAGRPFRDIERYLTARIEGTF